MKQKQNLNTTLFEPVGKAFVPKKFRVELRAYLLKAGFYEVPYKYFGMLFFLAILVTGIIYFILEIPKTIAQYPNILQGLYAFFFWAITSTVFSAIIIAGIYFYFNIRIFNRIKKIEDTLPEYLVLVSTNLKGGLSFEKSLWSSIKPEFGILSEEMSIVSKRVMTGNDLTEALLELSKKYDSPTLKRTLNIIIGEVESGGEVARVLDHIIEDLRKTRILKDEMAANTLMFTIFIGMIVVVISPLLFALAFNLLQILINVSAQVAPALASSGSSSMSSFQFDKISIETSEFKTFSVLALVLIATFASIILSIIQKGDIRSGLKYVPFFVASAVILYFLFLTVLGGMFNFI